MVKIKMKPINVSNTTLSLYGARRHRKFDAKQSKRHDYGTEVCAVCDKVFTKYHWSITTCSEECKRERKKACRRKHYEENREKIKANYEENREKENAKSRKYYRENRERRAEYDRKCYQENRKDPEWVEKTKARKRKLREKNRKDPELSLIHI